uniref:FLYWCH-type domain-containing protein n=1 Tax=Meloidogyne hapla TaxID=6305 RepID=A0A1I8BUR0_MELHA
MDIRAKLIEVQKSRKRRLPINDSSELSDVQLPEKNLEENNEENLEANLIKFEQGVTNKGNVALWHNDKNSNYWRCSNKDCPAKTKAIQKGGQFIGTLGKKEHNHPPAIQKKTAEEIRNKLKREARGNILAEVRANIPDEVYISLGTDCALKQLMSRKQLMSSETQRVQPVDARVSIQRIQITKDPTSQNSSKDPISQNSSKDPISQNSSKDPTFKGSNVQRIQSAKIVQRIQCQNGKRIKNGQIVQWNLK